MEALLYPIIISFLPSICLKKCCSNFPLLYSIIIFSILGIIVNIILLFLIIFYLKKFDDFLITFLIFVILAVIIFLISLIFSIILIKKSLIFSKENKLYSEKLIKLKKKYSIIKIIISSIICIFSWIILVFKVEKDQDSNYIGLYPLPHILIPIIINIFLCQSIVTLWITNLMINMNQICCSNGCCCFANNNIVNNNITNNKITNDINNTDNMAFQSGTRMNAVDVININNENTETKEEEIIRIINNMKKKNQKNRVDIKNNENLEKKKIKIFFIASSTGNKEEIIVSSNITVEQLIKIYLQKKHIKENVIGGNFFFLWNGDKLNHKATEIIEQKFKHCLDNITVITVMDINNILNAIK